MIADLKMRSKCGDVDFASSLGMTARSGLIPHRQKLGWGTQLTVSAYGWRPRRMGMMGFTEEFDVVVVGAGHAGCEAAMAAARMGLRTAIFTLNLDLIAQMSCNPAIGGIAKGHLVREVDALGGVMGEVADACGIQFRLLNTSRGPAVWSPRAQCDKALYRVKMREVLEGQKNLFIKQAEVVDLIVEDVEFAAEAKDEIQWSLDCGGKSAAFGRDDVS